VKYLLPIIALILLSGCTKDETGIVFNLPPITQSGANSFGFKLNNEVWINYGQRCFLFSAPCQDNLYASLYRNDATLEIQADQTYKSNDTVRSSSFYVLLNTGSRTGSFTLPPDSVKILYSAGKQLFEKDYATPAFNNRFNVTISKLDTLNNIVSGTFSGTLFRRTDPTNPSITSPNDSIQIKEGRFDARLVKR
jgi:hypothetical protein